MMKKCFYAIAMLGALILSVPGSAATLEEDYAFCTKVYNDLISAVGRLEPVQPKLVIRSNPHVVAEITQKNEILVGTGFIELCRSFGADSANALALVLGHELAHHYGEHFWAKDYGSAYANLAWGQKIKGAFADAHREMGLYESQADDFGLFYSYAAGYNTLGISSEVYDRIYEAYQLPDELPGYPPLEQRKQIALNSEERIKKLIPIFEAAKVLNVLSTVEEGPKQEFLLDEAISCYEHIINEKFFSREIFNNLGAAYLVKAINKIDSEDFPYLLPVVQDDDSRLYEISATRGGTKGFGGAEVAALAEKAMQYFERAKDADKNYIPAYINIANAQILLGKAKYAVLEAEEAFDLAEELKNDRLKASALDVWGIALAVNDKKEDALGRFALAEESGSKYSAFNTARLQGEPLAMDDDAELNMGFLSAEMELVNGQGFREYLSGVGNSFDVTQKLQDQSAIVGMKKEANGDLYVVQCKKSPADCHVRSVSFYNITNDKSTKTNKGIKVGEAVKSVEKEYGDPKAITSATIFDYYVYPDNGIIFRTADGKVDGWINYFIF